MSNFSAEIQARLNLTKVNKSLQSLKKTQITLSNVSIDMSSFAAKVQSALKSTNLTVDVGKIDMSSINSQMQSFGTQAGNSFSTSFNLAFRNAKTAIDTGFIEASIAKVTAQYEKLGTTGHAKLNDIKSDIQTLSRLQSQMNTNNPISLVESYKEFNTTLTKTKNSLATVSAESKTTVSSLQITTLDNKMSTWLKKNSKASKEFGAAIESLRGKLNALGESGTAFASEFKAIENEFNQITQSATAAGQTGTSFTSQLGGAFKSISKYISATTIIHESINALKEMYQNVYSIDTEMTELMKVTNETSEAYNNFLSNAGSTAKEIGTTISDLVSSTADFARLGYSFDDSQTLAEVANIYAVVGDEIDSIDTATESIISTMTAFHVEAEDAISIVDKFNEVGNNFAISSGGIGEALERSASSMAAANNTLDETIALITAANTVVQDADSVGTAFKTKFFKNCLYVQKCA